MTCASGLGPTITWAGRDARSRCADTGFHRMTNGASPSFYDQNRFCADDPGCGSIWGTDRTSLRWPALPGKVKPRRMDPDDEPLIHCILPIASYPNSQSPGIAADTSGTFIEGN